MFKISNHNKSFFFSKKLEKEQGNGNRVGAMKIDQGRCKYRYSVQGKYAESFVATVAVSFREMNLVGQDLGHISLEKFHCISLVCILCCICIMTRGQIYREI